MGSSDDEYQLFSSSEGGSSPLQSILGGGPRRLKKSVMVSAEPVSDSPNPDGVPLASPPRGRDCEESNGPRRSESTNEGFDGELESNSGASDSSFGGDHAGAKRALDFDSEVEEFDLGGDGGSEFVADLKNGKSESEPSGPDGSEDTKTKTKKERTKRSKTTGDNKPKPSRKESRTYRQQLHADSQRLLREAGDATFKPIPVVQKPISSVLEKIRKRKLELSKKATSLNHSCSSAGKSDSRSGLVRDIDSEVSTEVDTHDKILEEKRDDMVDHVANVKSDSDATNLDGSKESRASLSHESVPSDNDLGEGSMPGFRAPLNDTEDLISDSEECDANDLSNGAHNDTLEEVFTPSLLAMNLKLDSAPPEEVSDAGEDNDKEKFHHPKGVINLCPSPTDDPVKAFVDDEAEEEDDSDNDQRFHESEDEDNGEEEFNDLIATGNEEKAVDNEYRNQLHQQWLEQQDAAGTENLLQRLKYGYEQGERTLLEYDDEDEDEDVEEELDDEDALETVATDITKINSRKIKQMIPLMFDDKDEPFLSSDEEEMEQRLVKQRVLEKAKEQVAFSPLTVDESSTEVFSKIRKLNVVPDSRKKAKTASVFDTMLTKSRSNSFSKSSFVGRVSNSLPSLHKQGSVTARPFIFGRDDSNSRSTISSLDDSSDKVQMDNRASRPAFAKYVSSQSKSNTQNTKSRAEVVAPGASLFEILRRSSSMESSCTRDTMVSLPETAFSAFKCTKKTIKVERR